MVTITVDSWTIVSIILSLLIMAVVGLFLMYMEVHGELKHEKRHHEITEKYYREYRARYFSLKSKYDLLKKQK